MSASPPLPSLLSQPRHAPWGPSGSKGSGGGAVWVLSLQVGWAWHAGAVEVALGKSDKRRSVVRSASEHTVGLISRLSAAGPNGHTGSTACPCKRQKRSRPCVGSNNSAPGCACGPHETNGTTTLAAETSLAAGTVPDCRTQRAYGSVACRAPEALLGAPALLFFFFRGGKLS